jgi:hypothetical protein
MDGDGEGGGAPLDELVLIFKKKKKRFLPMFHVCPPKTANCGV